jgi:hypothetical protein
MYSDRDEWVEKNKYYYCGNKQEVPRFYCQFGSRNKCLRKGYGSALYKDSPKPPPQMVLCKKGSLKIEKSLNAYQKFVQSNFDRVKSRMRRPTSAQVLKELARLWRGRGERRQRGSPSPSPARRREEESDEEESESEQEEDSDSD